MTVRIRKHDLKLRPFPYGSPRVRKGTRYLHKRRVCKVTYQTVKVWCHLLHAPANQCHPQD